MRTIEINNYKMNISDVRSYVENNEIFEKIETCASNEYPLGTILKITNTENYKSVIVKVNDTGNLYGRTVDLSKKSF